MSDPLPSAPALRAAQVIAEGIAHSLSDIPGAYFGSESEREECKITMADLIDRECKIPELTAANAELLAALNNICDCISETRGADAYYHVETARALIAKHSPAKK